jgi:hypothetical protein
MVHMMMHHVAHLGLHFVETIIRSRRVGCGGLRSSSGLLCRSSGRLCRSARGVGPLADLGYATFKSAQARIRLVDASVYDRDMFIDIVLGRACA